MLPRKKLIAAVILCAAVFAACLTAGLLNLDTFKKPVFQKKTNFSVPASVKYENDGRLYVIDNGSFRLVCMSTEGNVYYMINIDKMKEYTKIYDIATDESGNLYVYAMEIAYDAFLTKRDMIRKYDAKGRFIENVFVKNYDEDSEERPHAVPKFGSLRCENGILTFSRSGQRGAELYTYNTYRNELSSFFFPWGTRDYTIGQLALKDFNNFIYTTQDGFIYEVKNGGPPLQRASFNFTLGKGGIIPWQLGWDTRGNIVFFDMVSAGVYTLNGGTVQAALPQTFFQSLSARGEIPGFAGFGFSGERFAGVYGETVWYYDGETFHTYETGINLSLAQRLKIIAVQSASVLGILAFLAGVYILFVFVLDRYISLFIKQIVIVIPLIIAAFILFYNITFNLMTERVNDELLRELNMVATVSAALIDGDALDSIQSVKDFNSAAYTKIAQTVKWIVGNNQDEWNKSYYAAVFKGANFEHCLYMSNDETNMFRPYVYLNENSEDYKLVMQGKSYTDVAIFSDGAWAYSDIGLFNSAGKVVGTLEIGIDMTNYQIGNMMLRGQVSLISALICLVILIVLTIIMSVIVRQLATIAKVLATISKGKYDVRAHYRGRDELGTVSWGLNSMVEKLQKQFKYISNLNESSARFVPREFMRYLGVRDITRMKLGDHVQKNFSILFFDIRSFSIHSEMMSAKENFIFINKVLSVAGPVFRKHHGFVDKYLGDAAMALFENGLDAVRAGLEIYRKIIMDKETRVKIGADSINIGIGVHSGQVTMGIVGENERLSSTVISKNVNMASRMESLTKQTKSGMLVTRETMNQIAGKENEFQFRFIGLVQVAGVNEVIGVFDMLDALPPNIRRRRMVTKQVFESGIRKYHTKDYRAAYERFDKIVKADPEDACAANCLAETRKRLENPGLPSVFVFDKK